MTGSFVILLAEFAFDDGGDLLGIAESFFVGGGFYHHADERFGATWAHEVKAIALIF